MHRRFAQAPASLRWPSHSRTHASSSACSSSSEQGETPCVFLAGLHRAERTIAERLTRLANGTLPWPWIDPDKALPWVEQRIGLALAESQVAATRLALISKVLVMTGGPGVGKTTIVKGILRILSAKGTNLLLCAPTGRAAKRMTEATGVEAKTIHRLLEVDPKGGSFKRGTTTLSTVTCWWSTRPRSGPPCKSHYARSNLTRIERIAAK